MYASDGWQLRPRKLSTYNDIANIDQKKTENHMFRQKWFIFPVTHRKVWELLRNACDGVVGGFPSSHATGLHVRDRLVAARGKETILYILCQKHIYHVRVRLVAARGKETIRYILCRTFMSRS